VTGVGGDEVTGPGGGGCSCEVPGRSGAAGGLLSLALMLSALRRRKRAS
jgi:MYXO-CTERM domain-containing protein